MKTSTLRNNRVLRILLPTVFWLLVWQIAATVVGQELLIPTPIAVLKRFCELVVTSDFWIAAGMSLLRIFVGAFIGGLLGIILAALTCRFSIVDMIVSPALRVIRAIPVASFIILVLLWVRKGAVPAVISGLMVMPVMWESVTVGIRSVDPQLLEMADCYGMSWTAKIRRIYLPSVKPNLIGGIRNCVGLAWKSGVAAEVLCLPKNAVGSQVYYSKIYLETPSLFAWTITVVLLSLILEKLIFLILRDKKAGDSPEN
ncbi:MAG: ABC transporter permease subunit [Oscillospiraceae bacterium]|nr:ABC transporter permease subunit [Oscillospiraceae bacterium]